MVAPEALLAKLLGSDDLDEERIRTIGPTIVPFTSLTSMDGWVIGDEENLPPWYVDGDDMALRVIRGLLIGVDYAVRRGATKPAEVVSILHRESPVAFACFDDSPGDIRGLIRTLRIDSARPESFARRHLGHELSAPFISDPVNSFEFNRTDQSWGGSPISSFVVHHDGEQDGVFVSGTPSEHMAIQVGLPADVPLDAVPAMEKEIAKFPSFLDSMSAEFTGRALRIGFAADSDIPDPQAVGSAIHAWTRALYDFDLTEVRIVFGPSNEASVELTEMRSRADAFRLYRDAVIAGMSRPEPRMTRFLD